MKKILQVVIALTFVFISIGFTTKSASAFMPGCSSTSGYSVTTGESCNVLPGCSSNLGFSTITGQSCNLSNLPVGCSSTQGYSPSTGAKCDGAVNTSLLPGCTSSSAYSTTTGQPCSNLPVGCASLLGFSITTGLACNGVNNTQQQITPNVALSIYNVVITTRDTSVKISWQTNILTESKVLFNGREYISESGVGAVHYVNIDGLIGNSSYVGTITAIGNNAWKSVNFQFTTKPSIPPVIPPAVPSSACRGCASA